MKTFLSETVDLTLELAPTLWATVADPTQLEQLVVNLVTNAKDATGSAGHLTIRTENISITADTRAAYFEGWSQIVGELSADDYVCITISDDGCGMSDETLEHIFEPFYSTKTEGTGLGLSTVYGIVQNHNGSITLRTAPGQGTTIKIFLRSKRESAQPLTSGPAPIDRSMDTNARILLVEDEKRVRSFIKDALSEARYLVEDSSNPEDALQRITVDHKEYDLLLTDVVLPKMNGKELATQNQARAARYKSYFHVGLRKRSDRPKRRNSRQLPVPDEAVHGRAADQRDPPDPGPVKLF